MPTGALTATCYQGVTLAGTIPMPVAALTMTEVHDSEVALSGTIPMPTAALTITVSGSTPARRHTGAAPLKSQNRFKHQLQIAQAEDEEEAVMLAVMAFVTVNSGKPVMEEEYATTM
jgi:hypothetical protein